MSQNTAKKINSFLDVLKANKKEEEISFFDISETIKKKISAMKAYKKEYKSHPHPRSSRVIEALATYRGAQVGINFAEGYFLLRTKNSN